MLLGAIFRFRFGFLAIESKQYPEHLARSGWILAEYFILYKSKKKKMEVFGYLGVGLICVLFVVGIWKDFIRK